MPSIYSAYEHSLLPSRSSAPAASSSAATRPPLPIDITIETLLGTFILLATTVFGASPLRPIQWAEWAGKIEREGWDPSAISGKEVGARGGRGGKGNPFRGLEERRGFWDVRVSVSCGYGCCFVDTFANDVA